MNDLDLPVRMRTAVADDPPYDPDLAAVVDQGIARRRRRSTVRRSTAGVAACLLAGAAFVAVPTLLPDGSAEESATGGVTTVAAGSGGGPVAATQGRRPSDPLDARIAAAVESVTPATWVLDLPSGDSSPGNVDGTADDGSGPGRIYVWTSTGTQLLHPCSDPDFRQGASCHERVLAGGSVLSVRGLVVSHGVRTYEVVLTHPDGSGAGAESGNVELGPSPQVISSDDKPRPVVTRADPTYDLEQLTALVEAVDAATR